MFWQIVLKKSYGSDVDTNYHHDVVQTHDADSGWCWWPLKCQNCCCTWARKWISDVRPQPSQLISDELEWSINNLITIQEASFGGPTSFQWGWCQMVGIRVGCKLWNTRDWPGRFRVRTVTTINGRWTQLAHETVINLIKTCALPPRSLLGWDSMARRWFTIWFWDMSKLPKNALNHYWSKADA